MVQNNKFSINAIIIITFSLLIGATLRIYNLNYENFWLDEILTFWISDPTISINESYQRHLNLEQVPFFFNLLIKFTHKIFGYETYVGRYLNAIFGIMSILSIAYISRIIKKNDAYLLTIFLVSFNVFLIAYSQELRIYSITLFIISINLVFLLKMQNEDNKKFSLFFFLFLFTQIIMIFSHPFNLIVFFAIALFSLYNLIILRKNLFKLNLSLVLTSIFVIIYFFFYFKYISSFPGWISQPDIKFYTNFYFSKFFGSRIVGLIHLAILISLIYYFKSQIKQNTNNIIIFIFILFLSYFLPLLYGYIFRPIIFPRYIIFVIIPIIVLISYFIFELKNKLIRNLLVLLIVILTLGNQLTETNVKQFFKDRVHHKPNFMSVLNEINNSNFKYYFIQINDPIINIDDVEKAYSNYFIKLSNENNLGINLITIKKLDEININKVWFICFAHLSNNDCLEDRRPFDYKILKTKNFSGVSLRLIEKIN